MKDYMADEAVAVLSFDKNTGLIKNVVSCDPENAVSQAKYFRLLGQNARIVRYDDLEFYLERDKKMYNEQNRLMRECGLDFKKASSTSTSAHEGYSEDAHSFNQELQARGCF